MLIGQGLVLEEAGGDVQTVAVSALKGTGLDDLIETINTQATILNLRAEKKGLVEATVIESKTDAYRGYTAVKRAKTPRSSFICRRVYFQEALDCHHPKRDFTQRSIPRGRDNLGQS